MQKLNQTLHNQLPERILKTKEIVIVNNGSYPPYLIHLESNKLEGASIDLANAIAEILGVTIKHEHVVGLTPVLMGVSSNRYDMAIGPIGDFVERQKSNDFIDYAIAYAALAVNKGNPEKIYSLNDVCGKRIAALAGATNEKRLIEQSKNCVAAGKLAIEIQIFQDQASAILSVKSKRSDAYYAGASVLIHYVSQAKDALELTGVEPRADHYPDVYQGAVVAKDSPLGPIILAAFQELYDNGTYHSIMKKWSLENQTVNNIGMNLGK